MRKEKIICFLIICWGEKTTKKAKQNKFNQFQWDRESRQDQSQNLIKKNCNFTKILFRICQNITNHKLFRRMNDHLFTQVLN